MREPVRINFGDRFSDGSRVTAPLSATASTIIEDFLHGSKRELQKKRYESIFLTGSAYFLQISIIFDNMMSICEEDDLCDCAI